MYCEIQCPDNDTVWLPDATTLCPACGCKTSRDHWNPDFVLKKTRYDLGVTYDGFYIASERFKAVADTLPGRTSFVPLAPRAHYRTQYYLMELLDEVRIDVARAAPQFGPLCGRCGQHRFIVGARASFSQDMRADTGLVRSDLQFADGKEKGYALLVGAEAGEVLARARLDGVWLEVVE